MGSFLWPSSQLNIEEKNMSMISEGTLHPDCVNDELMQRELELEKEMFDRGRQRFFANVNRLREDGNEGATGYGKILLKRGLAPFSEAIAAFLETSKSGGAGRRHLAAQVLDGMDPDVVAFIALRTMLDRLTRNMMVQQVAISIGKEIELEQKLANLEENDNDRYQMTQRWIHGHNVKRYRKTVLRYAYGKSATVDFEPWPDGTCLHIGYKLIELAINSTGLFMQVMHYDSTAARKGRFDSSYQLTPTPQLSEWIQHWTDRNSILNPDFMPTVIPPKAWKNASGGGYYSHSLWRLNLIKVYDRDFLELIDRKIENGEMPDVLTAVNALQDTAWAVNRRVLEVARHIWDNTEGDVADFPPRDGYRLPPCPVCGADITDSANAGQKHECFEHQPEEVLKEWRKQANIVRRMNVSCLSRRLNIAKTLHLADRYRDEAAFYFPYQLDFRGRIYAVPAYLNPQGTHLAKALLRFAHGKRLGSMAAVKWLAVHGSNAWGNDKVSLDERHSWVLQHQDAILAVADDPFNHLWWQEADDPWGFLAFCFEWAGYVAEGLDYVSTLPVAMDGTCNGLQIFSLMLRDEVGGHAVNLTPTEQPQDIYGIVAERVVAKLNACLAKDEATANVLNKKGDRVLYNEVTAARFLLGLGIDRKATKRQVMVLPYGGTFESCKEYTEVWIKDKTSGSSPVALPEGYSTRRLALFLGQLVWDAIGETVIKAREAMQFLQDTASICNKAGVAISWTTPLGYYVRQKYCEQKGKRVKTRIGEEIIFLTVEEHDSRKLNKQKQVSGISPNVVHSLDAAALMRTVCMCRRTRGITAYAMIHDSYGTLAADSEDLARILRETFVEMFGGNTNILEQWKREVLAAVPTTVLKKVDALPAVPAFGSLKVEDVLKSSFFFA